MSISCLTTLRQESCRLESAVDDRISSVRLSLPGTWFNKSGENMDRGLDCLRMYQAEYDDKNMTLKTRPLHNWASHGADAFGIGVMGMREAAPKAPTFKKRAVA